MKLAAYKCVFTVSPYNYSYREQNKNLVPILTVADLGLYTTPCLDYGGTRWGRRGDGGRVAIEGECEVGGLSVTALTLTAWYTAFPASLSSQRGVPADFCPLGMTRVHR